MKKDNWLIKLDFKEIKSMFDPIVERIIKMIETQLDNCRDECSIMFLVGGFSQSKYLKKRIEERFKNRVKTINVPNEPDAAIVRGATLYGYSLYNQLDNKKNNGEAKFVLNNRRLHFTYGIKVLERFKNSD